MKKIVKRIFCFVSALLLSLFTVIESTISVSVKAEETAATQETTIKDYSKTDIMDDLSDIDTKEYPTNAEGVPQVIRFQEYCYSEKAFFAEYFGLYVYIYNPTEKPLSESTNANYINMAIEYGADGEPTGYNNQGLKYCDKTDNCRFYKFKIVDSASFLDRVKAYSTANNGVRRYDIADANLLLSTGIRLAYTNYSKTYCFTGFAAGCGATTESESTLNSTVESLETIQIDDLNHTYAQSEQYVDGVSERINIVGFSVDQDYFDTYGKSLVNIHADWWEYKTTPVFVTCDEKVYSALEEKIGDTLPDSDNTFPYRVLWQRVGEGNPINGINPTYWYEKVYNGKMGNSDSWDEGVIYEYWGDAENLTRIDWLFLRDVAEPNSTNPFNEENRNNFVVSSEELLNYMQSYTENHSNQDRVGAGENRYAENLFEDSIDEDRLQYLENSEDKRGYVNLNVSAEESRYIFTVKEPSNWIEDLFCSALTGFDYEKESYEAIQVIRKVDVAGMDKDEFCSEFGLAKNNQSYAIFEDCLEAVDNGKYYILFRHSQTDYYSSAACFDYAEEKGGASNADVSPFDGYVFQETVFLDFDIIDLTFEKENGEQTVIAACSTPIDIFDEGTPPPSNNNTDYITYIRAVIAIVLVFFLFKFFGNSLISGLKLLFSALLKIFKWVGKISIYLISLPFKAIKLMVNRRKTSKPKSPPKKK